MQENPDVVLLLGDSNTSLAGISAAKLNVKVAHLEAEMRSNDWRMPEEKNRRIIDHISDYLFPPTTIASDNLVKEGINPYKIFEVSKIIIDVRAIFMWQTHHPILTKQK